MKKKDLQILEKRFIDYMNAVKVSQGQKGPFVFSGEGSSYDDDSDYILTSKRINARNKKK